MIGLKYSRHFLNQSDQDQAWLGRTRFPALGAGYVYLLRAPIGSLYVLSKFAVIGHCDCFGFGFTIVDWKPLL